MRRTTILLATVVLTGALVQLSRAQAATLVSGIMTQDTTWTTAGSPYQVTGNFGVDTGVTLTIDSGVTVQLMGNYKIQVAGRLLTHGTESAPVVFTCASQTRGCWRGIEFTDSQSGSIIDGAHVGYADIGIYTNSGAWTITDSWFHHSNMGLRPTGSCCAQVGTLTRNYISANGTGAFVFFPVSTFSFNTITDNDIGLSLLADDHVVQNNNIFGNSSWNIDTCFFSGNVVIDATTNWWGTTDPAAIASKICDRNDGDLNDPTVDFDPFATSAISGAATPPTPAPTPSPSASPTLSASPTPTPSPDPPTMHPRTLSLTLRKHLTVRGNLTSDGFTACVSGIEVTIQRKKPSGWVRVADTDTSVAGAFVSRIADKAGRYRAFVSENTLGDPATDVCQAAASATKRHRH